MVTETTGFFMPHPQPASCRVQRARGMMRDELARLAGIEMSARPGVPPERRSEYWLGRITGIASYLLWTLDVEEEAKNG